MADNGIFSTSRSLIPKYDISSIAVMTFLQSHQPWTSVEDLYYPKDNDEQKLMEGKEKDAKALSFLQQSEFSTAKEHKIEQNLQIESFQMLLEELKWELPDQKLPESSMGTPLAYLPKVTLAYLPKVMFDLLSFYEDDKLQLKPSQSVTSLPQVMRDQPILVADSASAQQDHNLQLQKSPSQFDKLDSIFDDDKDWATVQEGDSLWTRIDKSIVSIFWNDWAYDHAVHGCEPLIQVSVTLRKEDNASSPLLVNNNNSNELLQLYGEIYVHDGESGHDDHKCFIFQYDQYNPMMIPFGGGTLALSAPNDVILMAKPIISMNIRNKTTGEAFIDGSAFLVNERDTITQDHFDLFQTLTVGGGNGWYADVEYLQLMFAVHASVEIQLESDSGKTDNGEQEAEFKIYGNVTAEYSLFRSEKKLNRVTLYEINKDSNEFESVTLGCPITLSRPILVCPAYSSVTIRIELLDRTTNRLLVQGSYVFDSHDSALWGIIPGCSSLNARVTCYWQQPHRLNELCAVSSSSYVPRSLAACLEPNSIELIAHSVVEVFSIFIGHHQKDEQLSLHGMVNFCRAEDFSNLFYREKNNPYILPSGGGFLPLHNHSRPLEPGRDFFLPVDLEDSENKLVIKGLAKGNSAIGGRKKPWFDRPLSYIIKGEDWNGFAVVNYTVFSYAFVVSLKVHLSIQGKVSPGTCTGIYGSLVACYPDFEVKTHYERSFFRTVLFERNAENPLKNPSTKFDLELSRSWIPVQVNNRLLINVDLHTVSSDSDTNLIDLWEIKNGENNISCQRDGLEISVDVNWDMLPGKGVC